MTKLTQTLHATFGIDRLRPGQQEVIESVLQGHDTLAIMPTGAGKSLCYQLPALGISGRTVVVSPLISLMKDQIDKLAEAGLAATEVNSSLSPQERDDAWQSIRTARNEFIFTTPEQLLHEEFITMLMQHRVGLFVIDEAHCISQWGHDFRPAYLQLGAVIAALDHPVVLALTATAPEQVVCDIIKQLQLPNMRIINTGIYRPNLEYQVIQATNEHEKHEKALELVRSAAGNGIVYAATVKAVEQLHQALQQAGESVTRYHGRLSAGERERNQDAFMAGTHRIMVATNAFGMGIDKPDIRFILHYQLPANLQAYYQESGRAGRDSLPSKCILLYHDKDKQVQSFFLARRYPDSDDIGAACRALEQLGADKQPARFKEIAAVCSDVPESRLQVALKLLKDDRLLKQDRRLAYRLPDAQLLTASRLEQLAAGYRSKSEHDRQALERLVFYAQTGFCRWKILLDYFEEKVERTECGHCDNCRNPPQISPTEFQAQVQQADSASPTDEALAPGRKAHVPKFGEGEIVALATDQVTLIFPDKETRTFLRDYVTPA